MSAILSINYIRLVGVALLLVPIVYILKHEVLGRAGTKKRREKLDDKERKTRLEALKSQAPELSLRLIEPVNTDEREDGLEAPVSKVLDTALIKKRANPTTKLSRAERKIILLDAA